MSIIQSVMLAVNRIIEVVEALARGDSWIARTLPISSSWQGSAYGNGTFVVMSQVNGTIAASSTDGINWTARTLPANLYWQSTAFGNGVFVAIAPNTNIAATSI